MIWRIICAIMVLSVISAFLLLVLALVKAGKDN
jgi:hypothetical protein